MITLMRGFTSNSNIMSITNLFKTKIKKTVLFFAIIVLYCFCQPLAYSQNEEPVDLSKPRTWIATTGHKLVATYIGRNGNKIRLALNNGQVRIIQLENLSKEDQVLLDDRKNTENNGERTTAPDVAKSGKNHPFVQFLMEAKQKRLSGEDGIKYYQNVIDSLYQQIDEYEFKYPKDFINADNSFNTKYLKKIVEKKKNISDRKNLFTGEHLKTLVYANEPQWKSVSQEVRFTLTDSFAYVEQCDTLYDGNNEKKVKFGISADRKARPNAKYDAWLKEDSKDYCYIVDTLVETTDDEKLTLGGTNNKCWMRIYHYDNRKSILYRLNILLDLEGKISIKNSEEGSLQFVASAPDKKAFLYPRDDDGNYYFDKASSQFNLGRYDLNGAQISQEEKTTENNAAKPSSKHDDPLNIFAERNIKDK